MKSAKDLLLGMPFIVKQGLCVKDKASDQDADSAARHVQLKPGDGWRNVMSSPGLPCFFSMGP